MRLTWTFASFGILLSLWGNLAARAAETENEREDELEMTAPAHIKRSFFQRALGEPKPGALQRSIRAECDISYLEKALRDRSLGWSERAAEAERFLRQCQGDYVGRDRGWFGAMIGDYMMKYDFTESPHFQALSVKIGGYQRRLYLGLQPTDEPRPLVLIQCGMTCNSNSYTFSPAAMGLFDESPFHVLLIPSVSGTEFQTENKTLLVGGAQEGALLMQIARWARSERSPWRKQFSSVHVFGFSLGAHAALYSAAYESSDRARGLPPTIESVVAYCPVVDLRDSIEHLFSGPKASPVMIRTVLKRLSQVKNSIPILNKLLPPGPLRGESLPPLIGNAGHQAQSERFFAEAISQGLGLSPQDGIEGFWSVNDSSRLVDRIRIPTLMVGSEDDPIVSAPHNLHRARASVRGSAAADFAGVISLEQGGHCAMQQAYGWLPVMTLFRDFFHTTSSASVPLHTEVRSLELRMSPGTRDPGYRLDSLYFKTSRESDQVHIMGKYVLKPGEISRGGRLGQIEQHRAQFPLSQLDGMGFSIPTSRIESEALTRRLNAQLQLRFEGGFGNFSRTVRIKARKYGN